MVAGVCGGLAFGFIFTLILVLFCPVEDKGKIDILIPRTR